MDKTRIVVVFSAVLIFIGVYVYYVNTEHTKIEKFTYSVHTNITATVFWIGEPGDADNGFIPNNSSAWDDLWLQHYGGVDDPNNRNGYFPANFTPHENPFYIALPYNDFYPNGTRKPDAYRVVYWADDKNWSNNESMCKNRWVKIWYNGKVVYAQWEDVGPFEEDDWEYVFGNATPKNTINDHAGIDVSPAVRDYLGLTGMNKVSWQFVDYSDVPDGPWKEIITTSQICWC